MSIRKICFVVVCSLAIFSTNLDAQNAEMLIEKAARSLKNGDYQMSIENLELAKKEVEKQYADLLIRDLLPSEIQLLKLKSSDERSVNHLNNNQFYIVRAYKAKEDDAKKKENANKEENALEILPEGDINVSEKSIQLAFTNRTASVMEIIQSHNGESASNDEMPIEMPVEDGIQSEIKSIKINDHRAIIQYDKWQMQGRISVMVGATVIEVIGNGIENEEILYKSIQCVDFEKVLKKFGV